MYVTPDQLFQELDDHNAHIKKAIFNQHVSQVSHPVAYDSGSVLVDLEQGWRLPHITFEAVSGLIDRGVNLIHIEDQALEKKCGHLGGKVLTSLDQYLQTLKVALSAAHVKLGSALLDEGVFHIIARTDALSAKFIQTPWGPDNQDHPDWKFIDWDQGQTSNGYWHIKQGIDPETNLKWGLRMAIERAIATTPYASRVWMETPTGEPSLPQQFMSHVQQGLTSVDGDILVKGSPDTKGLYNISPSFQWTAGYRPAAKDWVTNILAPYLTSTASPSVESFTQLIKALGDSMSGDDQRAEIIAMDFHRILNSPFHDIANLDPYVDALTAHRLAQFTHQLNTFGFDMHLCTLPNYRIQALNMYEFSQRFSRDGVKGFVDCTERRELPLHQNQSYAPYSSQKHQQSTNLPYVEALQRHLIHQQSHTLSGSTEVHSTPQSAPPKGVTATTFSGTIKDAIHSLTELKDDYPHLIDQRVIRSLLSLTSLDRDRRQCLTDRDSRQQRILKTLKSSPQDNDQPIKHLLDQRQDEFKKARQLFHQESSEYGAEQAHQFQLIRQQQVFNKFPIGFDPSTASIRNSDYQVSTDTLPDSVLNQACQSTGPGNKAKMIANNILANRRAMAHLDTLRPTDRPLSGYMIDNEDAQVPQWSMLLDTLSNIEALMNPDKGLTFTDKKGKSHTIHWQESTDPTIWLRTLGLHFEHSFAVATIFAAKIAPLMIDRGIPPLLYLPKLEHPNDAKLWNKVLTKLEMLHQLPKHSIRVAMLAETTSGVCYIDELIHALNPRCIAINPGRWDKIASDKRTFEQASMDREHINMNTPHMTAYSAYVAQTAHKRGILAIGGMMAQHLPSARWMANKWSQIQAYQLKSNQRELPDLSAEQAQQLAQQAADRYQENVVKSKGPKSLEFRQGFDGAWSSSPQAGLMIGSQIRENLKKNGISSLNQRHRQLDMTIRDHDLLCMDPALRQPATYYGLLGDVTTCIQYFMCINHPSNPRAAAALVPNVHQFTTITDPQDLVSIDLLMEDAATLEICKEQLRTAVIESFPYVQPNQEVALFSLETLVDLIDHTHQLLMDQLGEVPYDTKLFNQAADYLLTYVQRSMGHYSIREWKSPHLHPNS